MWRALGQVGSGVADRARKRTDPDRAARSGPFHDPGLHETARRPLAHELTGVTGIDEAVPGVIVSDTVEPAPGQMREREFLAEVRRRLDQAGLDIIADEVSDTVGDETTEEVGLGDLYVDGIVAQSHATGMSIETLVGETLQMSCATAERCIDELEAAVPRALEQNRASLDLMLESTRDEWTRIQQSIETHTHPVDPADADLDWRIDEGWEGEAPPVVEETDWWAVFGSTPDEGEIRTEFPEIDAPLAAGLATLPNTVWGVLRPMLQGQIFHSIISAGYLAGRPPPAHPHAIVNSGGRASGLGRRRTDLRDPITGAVIEIKPEGDTGGAGQLRGYVSSLLPPPQWHEARDVPLEAWPPTGTFARYTLNPFLINFTLEAWNDFAAQPGMLYYRLTTTPGLPVYVPVHAPQPRRRFAFEIPRLSLPDFDLPPLPHIPPQVVAGTAVTGAIIVIVAATLIPGLPPPP